MGWNKLATTDFITFVPLNKSKYIMAQYLLCYCTFITIIFKQQFKLEQCILKIKIYHTVRPCYARLWNVWKLTKFFTSKQNVISTLMWFAYRRLAQGFQVFNALPRKSPLVARCSYLTKIASTYKIVGWRSSTKIASLIVSSTYQSHQLQEFIWLTRTKTWPPWHEAQGANDILPF